MSVMKNQLLKLKKFYKINNRELAEKIGISERQLYNVMRGKAGWLLREHIERMVAKIEAL